MGLILAPAGEGVSGGVRQSFVWCHRNSTAAKALRAAETTGRPLGNKAFIQDLKLLLGRRLARGRPGPAPKREAATTQRELWG